MRGDREPDESLAVARVRLRPEVRAVEQRWGLARWWSVKQSLTLEHFRLSDEEWFLLRQLNGRTTAAELLKRHARAFAPRRLTHSALRAFVAGAHGNGLVAIDGAAEGASAGERRDRRSRLRLLRAPLEAVSLRFSLFDPTRLLELLQPLGRALFGRGALALLVAVLAALVTLIVGRAEWAFSQAPTWQTLLDGRVFVGIVAAWCVLKAWHELGHAMACRRFGGECHDIGVMFVGLVPLLYCDVSDAWSFRSRYARAVVSAAGVYAELWVAAVVGFLWLFAAPGEVKALLFGVLAASTISTLAFNANPLLRLDGYYLLSDLVGAPNLHQRSQQAWRQPVWRWLVRGRSAPPEHEPHRGWLITYGVLSGIYRVFVVAVIGWFVWTVLAANGLRPLGVAFATLLAAGLVVGPIVNLSRALRSPTQRRLIDRLRASFFLMLLGGAVLAAVLTPLPGWVEAPCVVRAGEETLLVAPSAARVASPASFGAVVGAGDPLVTLENPDLVARRLRLRGRVAELEKQLATLEGAGGANATIASEREVLGAQLMQTRRQLASAEDEIARLTITAPIGGVAFAPRATEAPGDDGQLGRWDGLAASAENVGCWVEAGQPLCVVGVAASADCLAIVSQADASRLRVGSAVRLRLNNQPGKTLQGTVLAIAAEAAPTAPPSIVAAGLIAVEPTAGGEYAPLEPHFYVEVELDLPPTLAAARSVGRVRIETPPLSLAAWAQREISRLLLTGG